jgi:hypothetical protein
LYLLYFVVNVLLHNKINNMLIFEE